MKLNIFMLVMFALIPTEVETSEQEESIPVLTNGQLETYWLPEKKVAREYPRKALRLGTQGCVAVAFIIEPDGSTSNHSAIVVFPSEVFSESAITAAQQFRYLPTKQNTSKSAIYTANTFTYQIMSGNEKKDEKARELIEVICKEAANKALNADASDAGAA